MSEETISQLKNDPRSRFSRLSQAELEDLVRLTDELHPMPLFEGVSSPDLAYIAQVGEVKGAVRGDILIHQGDKERVMYVILDGQLRVWKEDEEGRKRLMNYHAAGDYCGELVFIGGEERAANVDVMVDASLVAFGQEGWDRLCEIRQTEHRLRTWGPERVRLGERPFSGKQWDEVTILQQRKSILALAAQIFVPALVIVLTLVIVGIIRFFMDSLPTVTISIVLAIVVAMSMWIGWMWWDWGNDDFIVSSKRVIHIERVLIPPFPLERREVAIEMIQEMTTTTQGLWTQLFDVHTLEIRTMGVGTIKFPYLDDADGIVDRIYEARDLAQVRKSGEERTRIRERLFRELGHDVQQVIQLDTGEQDEAPTTLPTGVLRVLDYFVPRTRIVLIDQVQWRQHWLILILSLLPVFGTFFVAAFLLIVALSQPEFLRGMLLRHTLLPGFILMVAAFLWYLWRYDAWRNHVYILTNSRIIDIEGTPFHLRGETRIEGEFGVIQNVTYDSPNLIYRALRIGDVYIDTAAQEQAYTFELVGHPDEVQQEIFRRLVVYRDAMELGETQRRYSEFADWFVTYHRSRSELEE
jgi:hypothetical protein